MSANLYAVHQLAANLVRQAVGRAIPVVRGGEPRSNGDDYLAILGGGHADGLRQNGLCPHLGIVHVGIAFVEEAAQQGAVISDAYK